MVRERNGLMEVEVILHQMLQLFIMMFLGYLLYKVKLIDGDLIKKLTKLLLHVTLPAMILASVLEQEGSEKDIGAVAEVFAVGVIVYVLLPLISILVVKLMHLPKKDQGLYAFMMAYSNVGFMGFPLMDALFGKTAVFYAGIINIAFNISVFTLGVILMHIGHSDNKKTLEWKKLMTPGISISLLSIIFYLLDVALPEDVVSVVSSVGNVTTPLAMILIGATLATMNFRAIFNDWHVYPFAAVRQIVLPLIFWPILSFFIRDTFILSVVYILLLLPIANTSVLFAMEYDGNEQLAAKSVFITTVLAIVTVPLMLMICG